MIDKGRSIAVLLILTFMASASAQDPVTPETGRASFLTSLNNNIPKPTLGGSQFWGDVHIFHDWRIQRRVNQEKYRLLDPNEFSHMEGTFGQCRAKLERIKHDHHFEPMRGRAVIILHGLVATRWTMRLLAEYLEEKSDYTIVNVEYPSTRQPMADHAEALARVVEGLPEVSELNFVGHSMGNIVIRHYLADAQKKYGRQDPRLGRVVMIAPPNHGSLTATRWSDNSAFKAILGTPGRQLGTEWTPLESALIAPPCPFGIIAGGTGHGGFSPFLPGDDDGRIAVATTRLAGASDFVVVPMIHEFIANDPRTFGYVRRFLDEGCFVAADQRQPIPGSEPPPQLARQSEKSSFPRVTWRYASPQGAGQGTTQR